MTQSLRLSLLVLSVIMTVEFAASFCAPLLPLIRAGFAADEYWVQMTISFYLFGLGAAALLYGPLSDVFGRRPMLLAGLGLFSLASLLCVWASSIHVLIAARLLQGMGAGVAWTVGNAAIKDVTAGDRYTRTMNLVHIIAGLVPTVAPILGSYLGEMLGWRQSFMSVFLLSCVTFALVALLMQESINQRSRFSFGTLWSGYRQVLAQPIYCRYMIVKVLMVMLLFVDSANLSLIFVEHLGVPIHFFGYYVTLSFVAYLAGGWICHRWVSVMGNDRLIHWGLAGVFCSTLVLLLALWWGLSSALWIQIIRIPLYMGWGLIFGNATACIVAPFPGQAGAASAMMIALEMLFSFVGIYICSVLFDGTLMPMAGFAIFTTVLAYAGFYYLRQHKIAGVLDAA